MIENNQKLTDLKNAIISGNIPQVVQYVISYALDLGTSDIHIEPEELTIRIRCRVDGKLYRIVEYPPSMHSAVISRIKVMSNLKIDETRIPQDGRTQVNTKDGRSMDLRVSTLPTVNGEKVVMRMQDKSRKIPMLSELGINEENLAKIKKGISSPNGIVLTTGPTGSGKTTTLYSCLSILNKTDVNIMTIEDPVEIQMDGLAQSQTHAAIDYTFARGLRAALRQDPDIIMVGEIRDKETIEVAIEAALTGHLVLSTLHTNSAAATIVRLLDMGIPAFLITGAINAIIAQRLVRRNCEFCKQPVEIDANTLQKIAKISGKDPGEIKAQKGVGCEKCNNTGYKGRVGVYEVMEMNDKLREMILQGASSMEIEKTAMSQGMKSLEEDGLMRVLEGITSLEEIYAVSKESE